MFATVWLISRISEIVSSSSVDSDPFARIFLAYVIFEAPSNRLWREPSFCLTLRVRSELIVKASIERD